MAYDPDESSDDLDDDLDTDDSDLDDDDSDVETDGTVDMIPAFLFDCPECGEENFRRSVTRYLDPLNEEDAVFLLRVFGASGMAEMLTRREEQPDFRVRTSTCAKMVECEFCGSWFAALPPGAFDPDVETGEDEG